MALTKKFIADGQDSVILTEYRVGPKAFQPHSRDGGKKRVPKTNYSDSESPLGTFTLTAYLPQQDWKEVKVRAYVRVYVASRDYLVLGATSSGDSLVREELSLVSLNRKDPMRPASPS